MISSETFQKYLRGHQPALESEIQDYLEGILSDALENLTVEDDDEMENIEAILDQFVDSSTRDALVALMRSNGRRSSVNSQKGNEEKAPDTASNHRQSLGKSLDAPKSSKDKRVSFDVAVAQEANAEPATKSHKDIRKQRREEKRKSKTTRASSTKKEDAKLVDDHESAWQECKEQGILWGGRGHGGRGVRYTGENYDNIHLPSVSLHFEGNELLVDSPMNFVRGHRYGLLGRNGVGKSTLMKQLASHGIPGMPHGMRILLVQQQIQGRDDQSSLEALVEADTDRKDLLQEMERVGSEIEQGIHLEENAQRLGEISTELDAIDADGAENRAAGILKGLSFTKSMIEGPTSALSGGWRMRLALAQALFVPQSDLILFDEVSNHLDLQGMNWLIKYLTNGDRQHKRTLMVVSHDRGFLDAICTDIVVMEHQRLSYHVGSYSDYERQMDEKAAHQAQILDASERQRNKALAFVQKQQNSKKSTDPNKQRQAKMVREKKLDRIGNYRDDGKRYKQFSLKKMDAKYVQLAQKVHIEKDGPVPSLNLPNPTWPQGVPSGSSLVQFEDFSFGYDPETSPLLKNLTLTISRGSKICLVGENGSGKSTLIKLITGDLHQKGKLTGSIWRHPSLRFGHVSQYSVEEMEEYHSMTVVEYAENVLSSGRASSSIIKAASGNVRQYLGSFGLGGSHALRTIGTLSGGERMRLCFATVLADEPHVLLLDESTNHCDLETLDAMSSALNSYQGTVLMVSHNQAFLAGFCKELWVLQNGQVSVSHSDTESFDELFSSYRNHILSSSASSNRDESRQTKAILAKKASSHAAGARKGTTLFA